MPPPFEEWWRGIKCYPCLCVRPSVIKIWCPLINFWKTASIQFKFGMLIYNIKTQVKFDLDYNPLIFDAVMGLLANHSTKIGVCSITFGRLHQFDLYLHGWKFSGLGRNSGSVTAAKAVFPNRVNPLKKWGGGAGNLMLQQNSIDYGLTVWNLKFLNIAMTILKDQS